MAATQTGLDLKANAADVYTKTDMNVSLSFKASASYPTFTEILTAPTLRLNDDATLEGNLYALDTGEVIVANKNQATPFGSLALGRFVFRYHIGCAERGDSRVYDV